MYAASFKSSVVNESSFNRLRSVSSGHSASAMGRVSRWSTLAHSTLLEDHGYTPVQVSAAGRAQGRQVFEKKAFETPPAHECSLGADMVSSLVNAKEYSHPSPLKDKLSSVSWLAWKHADGSSEEYLKAWQSLLAIQGHMIQCQAQSIFGLVVSVTTYGIIYLKMDTHDLGDGVALFTYNGLSKPTLALVTDHRNWKMGKPELVGPSRVRQLCAVPPRSGLCFLWTKGTGGSLLLESARAGFPEMSKPVLDKLLRHEGLSFEKGEPSKTLEDVLRKLLQHCLPKASADKFDEIIALRCKPKKVESMVAACSELLIEGNEDFMQEAASEDEQQELQNTVRRGKETRTTKPSKQVKARDWVAKTSLPEVASELHKAKELLPA
eukprot:6460065-Amphidinium_carterae.1